MGYIIFVTIAVRGWMVTMRMDEYINKNVLYEKIAQLEEFSRDRYLKIPSDSPCHLRYMVELAERTYFKRIITDLPAADVAPVRHGRWNDWEVFWKECSCCRYRTQKINAREYFFCPKCGAKMDLE